MLTVETSSRVRSERGKTRHPLRSKRESCFPFLTRSESSGFIQRRENDRRIRASVCACNVTAETGDARKARSLGRVGLKRKACRGSKPGFPFRHLVHVHARLGAPFTLIPILSYLAVSRDFPLRIPSLASLSFGQYPSTKSRRRKHVLCNLPKSTVYSCTCI